MVLLLRSTPLRVARKAALKVCGVSLTGDLHERAAEWSLSLPLAPARAERIARIRQAGVLFVHVPKNGGMAVCEALYATQLKHGTIRWYRQRVPQLATLPSFAILRDPIERFVSSFRYAVAGGSADNRVAAAFHDRYVSFRCLDEALDHVACASSVYQVDHIFRPQHWYLTDASGGIGVDRLFHLGDPAVARFVQEMGGGPLAIVNRSTSARPRVSSGQAERIRRLYRNDVDLYAAAATHWVTAPHIASEGAAVPLVIAH